MRRDEALNCMTFIVGRRASATGRVLVAHNEDDGGCVCVRHGLVPRARWAAGATMPAEPGCAAIPQVAATNGFFWSEICTPEGGMSTSDVFYNDRGVCVVSNSCMRSREDAPDLTDGGIAYNLRRAVAERAESARDAVHLLMVLVRRWGYASPGRAYTVADADEAFMIQIVHGKHYAALRVPDDAVVVMPNHYTIHCPSAFSEHWTSPRLESYARSRGWCALDEPFDFARAYQHPDSRMQPVNVLRQRFSVEALTGKPCPAEGMPFVVRPAAPVTVEKLMAMLANHYEGAPEDVRVGAGRTPHGSEHPRVCDGSTVESTVFDLYHNPRLTTVWLAAGRPCQQPWLPLHPLCGLPDALAPMADPAAELARHLCPDPSRMAHGNSGWQRLRDFGNEMEAVYGDNAEAVRAALADQRVRAARADAEAVARADALFAQGRVEEASAVLARSSERQASAALGAVASLAKGFRRAQVCAVAVGDGERWRDASAGVDAADLAPGARIRVTFACAGTADAESLQLGDCRTRERDCYALALPGSFAAAVDGTCTAQFDARTALGCVTPGEHICFLGGRDGDGHAFTARILLSLR